MQLDNILFQKNSFTSHDAALFMNTLPACGLLQASAYPSPLSFARQMRPSDRNQPQWIKFVLQ